jgi:hypothetical protein
VRIEPDSRIVAVGPGMSTVRGSAGGQTAEVIVHVGSASYDLVGLGPPRVLTANYIDLSKIERISRFRSAIGHHYAFSPDEPCRSMKHYYQPYFDLDWTAVDVYAPGSKPGIIWERTRRRTPCPTSRRASARLRRAGSSPTSRR